MGNFTEAEQLTLTEAFDRLLRQVGVQGVDISKLFSPSASTTLSNMTLHVDGTNGNDLNDGSFRAPLKTINAALRKLPYEIEHVVTILIASGTYNEQLEMNFTIGASGNLILKAKSWSLFTPTTGPANGTLDANFGTQTIPNTAVLTGATWTSDDLKGKFVRITSGTNSGQILPIANNAATTFDVGCPANSTAGRNIQGAGFEFVQSNVTLTCSTSQGIVRGSVLCGFTGTSTSGPAVRFEGINFDVPVGSGLTSSNLNGGNFVFTNCKFTCASTSRIFSLNQSGVRMNVNFSYIGLNAANACFVILNSGGHFVTLDNNVCDGGQPIAAFQGGGYSAILISGLWQNGANSLFQGANATITTASVNLIVRNYTSNVFSLYGYCNVTLTVNSTTNCKFLNNNGIVFHPTRGTASVYSGSNNAIVISGGLFDANANICLFDGSFNNFFLNVPSTISNTTGTIYNFTNSANSNMNSVLFRSTTSLSGNNVEIAWEGGSTTFANVDSQVPIKALFDDLRGNQIRQFA